MKKIVLLLVGVLFILSGCSSSKGLTSLNGFLEYELLDGWVETQNYQGFSEIAIEKEDGSNAIMVEYVEYSYDKPEGFMSYQEKALESAGAVYKDEDTIEEKGKKIKYKNYEVSGDLGSFIFVVGTVEFTKNQNAFLGFMGTSIGENPTPDEIINELKTIKFTDLDLSKERKVSSDKEYVEFTLSKGWRRAERASEYVFYKSLPEGLLYSSVETYSKKDETPQEVMDNFSKNFEANFPGSKVYLEETQDLKDRTITTKVYEYILQDLPVYTYFNIIEFKNSDLFAVASYDISSPDGFDDVKEELQGIVKSVKLKKGAEKQFEQDRLKLEEEKSTEISSSTAEETTVSEQEESSTIKEETTTQETTVKQ